MIDDATIAAGQIVIGIAVAFGLVHLAVRSPVFRWSCEVFALVAWLLVTVALPAAWWIYDGNLLNLVVGIIGFGLWVPIGWPALRRTWRLRVHYFKVHS